ncbi:leucine-rich repeat domain-containing protein [Lactococcus garvieae]|uniref:leucine-rich repeat domain-containing protein n=1 Tax=Lactococcus garvieae TaxID=1363 RepID=UPI0032493D8E
MKKIFLVTLSVFASFLMFKSTTVIYADSSIQQPPVATKQEEIANIPDVVFKRYINTQIFHRAPETDVLISELNGLTGEVSLYNPAGWPAESNAFSDLTGIEHMVNVESLKLANQKISDLKPLSTLTNLKELDLSDNNISNINELSNLMNLQTLDVSNYREYLRLTYNKVLSISALSNMSNLSTIKIENQIDAKHVSIISNEFKLPVDIRDINGSVIRAVTPTNNGIYDPKTNTVIWNNVLTAQPEKMTYQWNNIEESANRTIHFSGEKGVVAYY